MVQYSRRNCTRASLSYSPSPRLARRYAIVADASQTTYHFYVLVVIAAAHRLREPISLLDNTLYVFIHSRERESRRRK